jgi:hypothetical protein
LIIPVENLTKRGIRVTDIVWNLNIRTFFIDGRSHGGDIARSCGNRKLASLSIRRLGGGQ